MPPIESSFSRPEARIGLFIDRFWNTLREWRIETDAIGQWKKMSINVAQ